MANDKKDNKIRAIILEERIARLEKMINEEIENDNKQNKRSLVERYRRNT